MRYFKVVAAAVLAGSLTFSPAQVPSAELLFPDDTIALATIPDYPRLAEFYETSPAGRLWSDPAMKPFRDKFTEALKREFLEPLRQELGVEFSQYKNLLKGQVTLGFTPPAADTESLFGLLLVIDTKDQKEALATLLADSRKKWTESGKESRTESIRGVEFTRLAISQADVKNLLKRVFPSQAVEDDGEIEEEGEKTEYYIGRSDSLFIAGENRQAIEKLLARQGGGQVAPLAEQPGFEATRNLLFRQAMGYGWLNFKPIYQRMVEAVARQQQENPGGTPFPVDRILPALGLDGLNHMGMSFGGNAEGTSVDMFVSVPEARRQGLFRVFALQNKPSGPPPFVPNDVLKFQRMRLDAKQAWAELEAMLNKIDPGMMGMMQLMLGAVEAAGQEQDPNFSFKGNFIGNLGDDFISYEKAPRGTSVEDLANVPALMLLGSPNAAQLADAMRFVMMLAPIEGPPQEREFLGKKIYSITTGMPAGAEFEDGEAAPAIPTQTLSFAASGDYVAISTDAATLEEYLRSGEPSTTPLRERQGLAQAAQQVGGMETGLFNFENQRETYRVLWDSIKSDPDTFAQSFSFLLPGAGIEGLSDWVDFKLLPEYDRVAKYFGFSILSAGSNADGYMIRAYGPTPAELR